jgi:2-polyprenyl-6-methoxyphenol hydroxylase-like FAD-dependent oxidoreductase
MAVVHQPEIVIVGGGISGGALATVLARDGVSVAVLERDARHVDRVRGEWMAPWGVAEASRLGLLDDLRGAGGIHPLRSIDYDETLTPERAEASAIDLRALHPIGTGPLCMSHPRMCETLCRTAAAAGAEVLRGVSDVKVSAGVPPEVSFRADGRTVSWRPRLVVGADGRNSTVQRQLGLVTLHDDPRSFIGGMLVDGVSEWPQELQSLGTEGDIHYLLFPQGGTKLRLYICYGFEGRGRFTGPVREQNFLAAFRLKCLPLGDQIARGRPIGPLHSYSNEDHWIEEPTAPGVVLIGDAAGHNDPVIGQGASLALRDVRVLHELLRAGDWRQAALRPYVEERLERMRRVRITARFAAKLRVEFGPTAAARRATAFRRIFVDRMLNPYMAVFGGPDVVPAEAFEERTIEALVASESTAVG